MDGLRGELEGTLARTAQKKQTTLSRYTRYLKEQEKVKKYGFASRPASTSQVTDLKGAEHFYREVRAEFSDKLSRMNRDLSVETHGTTEIRAINEELNALRREMSRWATRVQALGGENPEKSSFGRRDFSYFGVAKQLPEATEGAESAEGVSSSKRPRDEEIVDDEDDLLKAKTTAHLADESSFDDRVAAPVSFMLSHDEERRLRKEESILFSSASAAFQPLRSSVVGYTINFTPDSIPTAASAWEKVLERKKAALRARLAAKK